MTGDWQNCPLIQRYRKTRRAYIKELMLEKWKDGQRVELWNAIMLTFEEIEEPKKAYWMNRLFSFYCHRFYFLTDCDWLVFLGEMNDTAAYGNYRNRKARYYCCRIRDTAWWLTHNTEDYQKSA